MTTLGSNYVFPLGRQVRQGLMFLHLRRKTTHYPLVGSRRRSFRSVVMRTMKTYRKVGAFYIAW